MMRLNFRIMIAALAIFPATQALSQVTPKFSGQVWVDFNFQDRFAKQRMWFNVSRALIAAEADLAPRWSAHFSLTGSTGSSVGINDAYLRYQSDASSQLQVLFGEVKLPYFDFVEESFAHRWATLHSQAERGDFLPYRDEGVRADFLASDNLRLSAMLRNGAENQVTGSTIDADLAANFGLVWRISPSVQAQLALDHQAESDPLDSPARTAVAASLGIKYPGTAALIEFNYRNDHPRDNDPAMDSTGVAVFGQHSFDGAIDADTDSGLLASVLTGSDVYRQRSEESLRFSLGGYRKFSQNLRTTLTAMLYQGTPSSPMSDGAFFFWNWEAKF